jgi:GGDEF domain-containing protein
VEPFDVDGNEITITASIGVSLYPDDGDAAELL